MKNEKLVVLVHASNGQEAKIIQAVLHSAGIPAVVEGESLVDGWAMAQKLLGRVGSEVKVPASARERALEVLEEARGDPIDLAAHVEPGEEPEPSQWGDDPAIKVEVRNPRWIIYAWGLFILSIAVPAILVLIDWIIAFFEG